MQPINRPWWEQVTALVSLSVSGALTGFSFVPKAPAELKSPSGMPIHLMALAKAAQPAPADDAALRSAIINVTNYFLRMAASKTPAQMEAIIWHHDSIDGVDHGESCAAFASLTLELAAQAVGQQSWVTGGTSYPWPLHKWADVRVDPNPGSLGIVSVLQDAEAHHRWHPLGDGYTPLAGDWVLFDGHVEVVTKYANGVLQTVGGDSLPNFSVNAHTYPSPLGGQGVAGFVNNGEVPGMGSAIQGSGEPVSGPQANQASPSPHKHGSGGGQSRHAGGQASLADAGQTADGRARIPGAPRAASARARVPHAPGDAAVPGLPVRTPTLHRDGRSALHPPRREGAGQSQGSHEPGERGLPADRPRTGHPRATAVSDGAGHGAAAVPGLPTAPGDQGGSAKSAVPAAAPTGVLSPGPAGAAQPGQAAVPGAPTASPYGRNLPATLTAPANDSAAEQAFINEIAPWAMAAQRRYGVPASVTIAQAIDESGWGRSVLATRDHNLFGIKGSGPAGTDLVPTTEYQSGQLVSQTSPFRMYHNIAESVDDHGKLLATSQYYRQAMADRHNPNAFATALTGVYATDPQYGAKLVSLMQHYDLYRYDTPAPGGTGQLATSPSVAPRSSTPATQPHTVAPTPGPRSTAPRSTTPSVALHTPAPGPTRPTVLPTSRPRAASPSPAPDPAIPGAVPPAAPPSSTQQRGTPAGPTQAGAQNRSGVQRGTTRTPVPRQAQRRAPTTASPTAPARGSAQRASAPADGPPGSAPRGTAQAPSSGAAQQPAAPAGGTAGSRPAPRVPGSSSPARRAPTRPGTAGGAAIPGLPVTDTSAQVGAPHQVPSADAPVTAARLDAYQAEPTSPADNAQTRRPPSPLDWQKQRIASRRTNPVGRRYQHRIPPSVWTVLIATARGRLLAEDSLYRDVASRTGIRWELLAACDWMQCKARQGYSPVQGEKLGTVNTDGTIYRTKSEALGQCAQDLTELAGNVYRIDLTASGELSVCELANVFAAFRWGGLLRLHHTSAMEFPYSVAGLTAQHTNMRWPKIDEPNAPDKPGSRFRMPFGAVPVVLSLNYSATI